MRLELRSAVFFIFIGVQSNGNQLKIFLGQIIDSSSYIPHIPLTKIQSSVMFSITLMNILNWGGHADNNVDFQEFMTEVVDVLDL